MSNFYKNFVAMCAKHGMTPSGAATAIGLSSAAASGWKNGKEPRNVTVNQLAKLFNCKVEELIGQEDTQEPNLPADSLSAAFFGGDDDLTPEENAALFQDALEYYNFKRQQLKEKKRRKE